MFKQFICVFLLLSITLAITDRQIIQQTLNGIYEQNKLADPTTITDCDYGDDDVDHQIVVFVGTQLEKCAKGSLSELFSFFTNLNNFINTLPQPVIDCISTNAEVDDLAVAYDVKDVDIAVIKKKLIAYLTLHYLTIHKQLVELDNLWYAGNYYQVGFIGGGYLHLALAIDLVKQMRQRRY